ncbi:MAG: epimerase [Rhodanobacteraceae bacterium]
MQTTRRHVLKLSAGAVAGFALRPLAALARPAARAAKPLRILILGGTGFIGPDEVRYALARGHKLTLFNRGKTRMAWPGDVEELVGDRNTGDLKALQGREWDVCIDNPTTLPFWVRDAGHALRGKVGQYIFISTISVYANNDKPGADETAALATYTGKDAMAETQETLHANIGGLYGPLKALSEKESRKQFPDITTIIRPGLIVGPGDPTDRFTYWPVRLKRAGEVLAPGDGSDPVQVLDARDLAEWTIRMAEARHFGVFNATGPNRPMTMREMLGGITDAIHSSGQLTWVPADFLDKHQVQPWSDMPAWVPAQGDTAGFARRSNRAAIDAGLTFRSLGATAIDTLTWFRTLPADRQSNLKAGLSSARETRVLAEWRKRDQASKRTG